MLYLYLDAAPFKYSVIFVISLALFIFHLKDLEQS